MFLREKTLAPFTLRDILDAIGDAVCISDLDDRIIEVNAAMEEKCGLPREELLSRRGYELAAEGDRERVLAAIRTLVETGLPQDLTVTGRLGKLEGRTFWIAFSLVPNEKGQPQHIVSVTRDITSQKKAENGLRFNHALLEALLETSPDGVLVVDAKGKTLLFNERFSQLYDIPQELLDSGDEDRMIAYAVGLFRDADDFLTRVRYLYEHPLEKATDLLELMDGRFVERVSSPLAGSDGTYYGRVWFFRDLTGRKSLEKKILDAKTEWESTFDAVPDFIMVVDERHRIQRVNRALAERLGVKPRDLVGRTCHECVHGFHAPPDFCPLHSFLTHGRPKNGLIRDSRLGEYIEFSFSSLESAAEGKRTVHLLRDVSSQKRLETQIVNIAEKERNRIGMDLHDGLGQNLTGIAFLCKSLQSRLEDQGSNEALASGRILALVEQSIDEVRGLVAGISPVNPDPNGLEFALRSLAGFIEDTSHVSCNIDFSGFVALSSDAVATHLYRIAQEAVHNAVRHGQAEHITITLGGKGNSIFLSIANDGKKFTNRKGASRGLGLETMKYRAEVIGARLTIEERSGGGTLVTVRIPWPEKPENG